MDVLSSLPSAYYRKPLSIFKKTRIVWTVPNENIQQIHPSICTTKCHITRNQNNRSNISHFWAKILERSGIGYNEFIISNNMRRMNIYNEFSASTNKWIFACAKINFFWPNSLNISNRSKKTPWHYFAIPFPTIIKAHIHAS